MARGRHVRRSGLLARLRLSLSPGRPRGRTGRPRSDPGLSGRLAALENELARLRVLGIAHAAAAASADIRARRAEEQWRAARQELTGLHGDLAVLREELTWAFAEGRLPVAAPAAQTTGRVIDLRDAASAG